MAPPMIGLKEPLQKGHFGSQTRFQFRVFDLLSQERFWVFWEGPGSPVAFPVQDNPVGPVAEPVQGGGA
jgi:hypothetical protein